MYTITTNEVVNGRELDNDRFIKNLKAKFGNLAGDAVQLLLDEAIEQHKLDRVKHWHYIKKKLG